MNAPTLLQFFCSTHEPWTPLVALMGFLNIAIHEENSPYLQDPFAQTQTFLKRFKRRQTRALEIRQLVHPDQQAAQVWLLAENYCDLLAEIIAFGTTLAADERFELEVRQMARQMGTAYASFLLDLEAFLREHPRPESEQWPGGDDQTTDPSPRPLP